MKKNSEHTKKVIRLFKWFLICHGVVDEYKKLLKDANRKHYNDTCWPASQDLILAAFGWPDVVKWGTLHNKWKEICHAFNL